MKCVVGASVTQVHDRLVQTDGVAGWNWGAKVLEGLIAWLRGDKPQDDEWPMCPDHHVPMVLSKKTGKPARYADQENETYTMIFRCPVEGCDQVANRTRMRTQIPVTGEPPDRPSWVQPQNTNS